MEQRLYPRCNNPLCYKLQDLGLKLWRNRRYFICWEEYGKESWLIKTLVWRQTLLSSVIVRMQEKRATIKSSPTGHFTFRTVSHLVGLPHGYNYALLFERVFSITLGAVILFLLCLVIIKFSCFIITPSNCLASYWRKLFKVWRLFSSTVWGSMTAILFQWSKYA